MYKKCWEWGKTIKAIKVTCSDFTNGTLYTNNVDPSQQLLLQQGAEGSVFTEAAAAGLLGDSLRRRDEDPNDRIAEMMRRNARYLPHLRSAYPIESQVIFFYYLHALSPCAERRSAICSLLCNSIVWSVVYRRTGFVWSYALGTPKPIQVIKHLYYNFCDWKWAANNN